MGEAQPKIEIHGKSPNVPGNRPNAAEILPNVPENLRCRMGRTTPKMTMRLVALRNMMMADV
jgi:hypothetical protein